VHLALKPSPSAFALTLLQSSPCSLLLRSMLSCRRRAMYVCCLVVPLKPSPSAFALTPLPRSQVRVHFYCVLCCRAVVVPCMYVVLSCHAMLSHTFSQFPLLFRAMRATPCYAFSYFLPIPPPVSCWLPFSRQAAALTGPFGEAKKGSHQTPRRATVRPYFLRKYGRKCGLLFWLGRSVWLAAGSWCVWCGVRFFVFFSKRVLQRLKLDEIAKSYCNLVCVLLLQTGALQFSGSCRAAVSCPSERMHQCLSVSFGAPVWSFKPG
jgi:hypothetical protein